MTSICNPNKENLSIVSYVLRLDKPCGLRLLRFTMQGTLTKWKNLGTMELLLR